MKVKEVSKKLLVISIPIFIFTFFGYQNLSNNVVAQEVRLPSGAASFVSPVIEAKEGGTQTTACKLGVNSASTLGDLINVDAANESFKRGYNYGWVLGILTDIKQIEDDSQRKQLKQLIQDYRKSGTNVIIRLCTGGAGACVGLGPQDADAETMSKHGKNLGQQLVRLAYELMQEDSNSAGAKTSPFWVVAGHNEANAAEWRDPAAETTFMNSIISEVSDSYKVQETLAKYIGKAADKRITDPGVKPNEGLFFGIRSRINLLSPVMMDIPGSGQGKVGALKYYDVDGGEEGTCKDQKKGYFNRMIKCGAMFGETVGIAVNVYTIEHVRKALEYAQIKRKKIFILESGPEDIYGNGGEQSRNTSNSFNSVLTFTNKQAEKYRYTFIDQFINHPQIEAILPFNSLTLSDVKERKEKTDPTYTFGMYPRKDAEDAKYFTKLAGTDMRYKVGKADKFPDLVSKAEYPQVFKTEPVSLNMGWGIFYEAQMLDMLNSSGCSNVFTRQCNYSPVNSDNNKVYTTNKTAPNQMKAYYDMLESIQITDSDAGLAFGSWEKDLGCKEYAKDSKGKIYCPPQNSRKIKVNNMLKEAVFRADMVTTVQVNLPLANTYSNTNISGTDELNYTQYAGALKRLAYQNNVDFARKSDATLQIEANSLTGETTQIAFPQLGSALNIYSRDYYDYTKDDPDVLRNPLDFTSKTYYPDSTNPPLSPSGRRLELQSTNRSLKSLSALQTPYSSDDQSKLFRPASIQTSFDIDQYKVLSSNIHDPSGINADANKIPLYLAFNNNQLLEDDANVTKATFNASEILSGEANVRRKRVDEENYVKCSDITNFNKDLKGSNNKDFQTANRDVPTSVNYDQDYKEGRCDAFPDGGVPETDVMIVDGNGNKVAGETPQQYGFNWGDKHLTTVSKDCYRAWCQIASNKRRIEPDLELTGGSGEYVNGSPDEGLVVFDSPNGRDYHFLKKITTTPANVISGTGMMRMLRTAWEQSNRYQYTIENSQANTTNTASTTIKEPLRICHKNISIEAKTYTRNYTVSSTQQELYSGNNDQCYNPNNQMQANFKSPSLKPDNGQVFMTSTADLPWMGTIAAINERLSKSDYDPNNVANKLPKCGDSEAKGTAICFCEEDQKDPMAIFLCKNGWLTEKEMENQKLTEKDCEQDVNIPEITGAFYYGKIPTEKSCENYNKPEVQKVFNDAVKGLNLPVEVLAAIWQEETGCSLPGNGNLTTGKVNEDNNQICMGCNLEGAGLDPSVAEKVENRSDPNLEIYNKCKNNNVRTSCSYSKRLVNYNTAKCCDVRGAFQSEYGTWSGYLNSNIFKTCRTNLGRTGTPDRAVFVDSLCGAVTEIMNTYNSRFSGQSWENLAIPFAVAQKYHGGTSCLNIDAYLLRKEQIKKGEATQMTPNEKYCGDIISIISTLRNQNSSTNSSVQTSP